MVGYCGFFKNDGVPMSEEKSLEERRVEAIEKCLGELMQIKVFLGILVVTAGGIFIMLLRSYVVS